MKHRYLIFDESGNLGVDGRYFVISCIDTCNKKSLENLMKKKLLKARNTFPDLCKHSYEIKAKDAYPCVKFHIIESINKLDLTISYIVADLHHINANLLQDKNILYNYMMKILVDELITDNEKGRKISIISDNKTTKIASKNSFSDYIKIALNYERGLDLDLEVVYLDSNAKNAFIVQAADYVANAIYTKYEYNYELFECLLAGSKNIVEEFPRNKFGR